MWHMYSVFEEIFGHQSMMTTSSNHQALKQVVVGDRLKMGKCKTPTSPPVTSSSVTTISQQSCSQAASPVKNASLAPISTPSLPPKVQKSSATSSSNALSELDKSGQTGNTADDPMAMLGLNTPSNQLLNTIGELANTNADSDDSDLDIVYQQLRYQERQRKPEQMRIRTHRAHHHQQVASSDPESIGYAGSNSIDSGYKSLCATPEVSDTLSAPEVRRSASDVSASDSSTTSGRPRSLDGQDSKSTKIKMGTRSVAGKFKTIERRPHTAMDDVTLDHLMYLRQSLRKDTQRSPSESAAFRDFSRRDEGRMEGHRAATSSSGGRSSSRGDEEIDQEGGGESSSDLLLSGVEYYDLESIRELPPTSNYVTTGEEKTRCARFQLISASKCAEALPLSSLYRKPTLSVDRPSRIPQQHVVGHPRTFRSAAKLVSRHHRQHHTTDSKLTEAAIRVLEMIEDFRMEEAMTRSPKVLPYQAAEEQRLMTGSSGATGNYPSTAVPHQSFLPRYRKTSGFKAGARPASTGSLLEQERDSRSIASSSSYTASAEHHVYEEIMYDLVCERAAAHLERGIPPPVPPERERVVRSRLLPVPPHAARSSQIYGPTVAMDPRRIMVRSHKHRSSNLYPMLLNNAHGRSDVDRFLEMEWHLERRDSLPPDFPV